MYEFHDPDWDRCIQWFRCYGTGFTIREGREIQRLTSLSQVGTVVNPHGILSDLYACATYRTGRYVSRLATHLTSRPSQTKRAMWSNRGLICTLRLGICVSEIQYSSMALNIHCLVSSIILALHPILLSTYLAFKGVAESTHLDPT